MLLNCARALGDMYKDCRSKGIHAATQPVRPCPAGKHRGSTWHVKIRRFRHWGLHSTAGCLLARGLHIMYYTSKQCTDAHQADVCV